MGTADDGWSRSAEAWIADQGDHGDFSRRYVLDPVMVSRIQGRGFRNALDVGCGEGRFCRILVAEGVAATGLDPTERLLEEARARDPGGDYRTGRAEALDFADGAFDLVISYLTLIDIPDHRAAIAEMVRVLRPGGALLIANLNPFVTAHGGPGWVRDGDGNRLYIPLDTYLQERPDRAAWRGIDIINWHRPMEAYLAPLLSAGLRLIFFAEPSPAPDCPADLVGGARRVPFFHVMEWEKAG
ncbi:MAG: class I SAM-dependent methyltransferase [Pseudomonadota bacterium]